MFIHIRELVDLGEFDTNTALKRRLKYISNIVVHPFQYKLHQNPFVLHRATISSTNFSFSCAERFVYDQFSLTTVRELLFEVSKVDSRLKYLADLQISKEIYANYMWYLTATPLRITLTNGKVLSLIFTVKKQKSLEVLNWEVSYNGKTHSDIFIMN